MVPSRIRWLALGVTLCVLAPGAARADKCTSSKLKAIAKKESGLLSCQAKVAGKGDPSLQSDCDAKVLLKFSAAFAKPGPCTGVDGVEADCESIAEDCRDTVRAQLPDAGPSKCEAARLKAAGKKAKAKLGCYAKATLKGVGVDGTCLTKAETKFSAAFTKVSGCTGDGQAGAVEALVDGECVNQQVVTDGGGNVTGLCPTTTTTTTVTTTTATTTTTILCGNNRVD